MAKLRRTARRHGRLAIQRLHPRPVVHEICVGHDAGIADREDEMDMIHQAIPVGTFMTNEAGRQRSEIQAIREDYLRLKDKHLGRQMEIVGPLLDDWILNRTEVAESNRIDGATYNPIARIKINETTHSRIIGDLLDPNGTHGQGNLFLVPFLEELGIPEPNTGLWHVTVETGRVDILIWRNLPEKCAVIIENKSNGAGDRPNQIYRYWHREIFLWEPCLWISTNEAKKLERERRFHVVYLLTDGGRFPEQHSLERPSGMETANPFEYVPLECRIISLAVLMVLWEKKSVPQIPPKNHRLRAFLSQYHELWTK